MQLVALKNYKAEPGYRITHAKVFGTRPGCIHLTKEKEMIVERQGNGSILISDIVDGYWIKKVYYFYSKKEAVKLFREHKKEMQPERVNRKIIWKETA